MSVIYSTISQFKLIKIHWSYIQVSLIRRDYKHIWEGSFITNESQIISFFV